MIHKKGFAQFYWIILGIVAVAGFFVAKPLFMSVSLPYGVVPGSTLPTGVLNTSVNMLYYDKAWNNYLFDCDLVDVRMSWDPNNPAEYTRLGQASGSRIALDWGGEDLTIYEGYGAYSSGTTSSSCDYYYTPNQKLYQIGLYGIYNVSTSTSSRVVLCMKIDSSKMYANTFIITGNTLSFPKSRDTIPAYSDRELLNNKSTQDTPKRYVCRNNNVVLQSCKSLQNDFIPMDICHPQQPCNFLSSETISFGVQKPVVKCGTPLQKFKLDYKQCVGDSSSSYSYSVSNDGTAFNPPIPCEHGCENGICNTCIPGYKRCKPLTTPGEIQICDSGQNWVTWAGLHNVCVGDEECVETSPDAICTIERFVREQRCFAANATDPDKHQQKKLIEINTDGTEVWANLDLCRTPCRETGTGPNRITYCVPQCEQNACVGGELLQCLTFPDPGVGNKKMNDLGACVAGCKDITSCNPAHTPLGYYCHATLAERWNAISNLGNLLGGGVSVSKDKSCPFGCSGSNCNNAPGCTSAGQQICVDNPGKKKICSQQDITQDYASAETCDSGLCNTDVKTCKPKYPLGSSVCQVGNELWRAANTGNVNDIYGGIKTSYDRTCLTSCIVNGRPNFYDYCQPKPGCENKPSQYACYLNHRYFCSNTTENYVSDEDCTQLYEGYCDESTKTCKSTLEEGQTKCEGLQPVRFDGTNWVSLTTEPCDIRCKEPAETGSTAQCELECPTIGYSCIFNGITATLGNCKGPLQGGDEDRTFEVIGNCIYSQCTTDFNKCKSNHESSILFCSQNNLWVGVDTRNDYDLYGGVRDEQTQDCDNTLGCVAATGTAPAHCQVPDICRGKSNQNLCLNSFTSILCSPDEITYISTSCLDISNGYCNNATGLCTQGASQCTADRNGKFCTAQGVIKYCNNGNIGEITPDGNCAYECTTLANGDSKCIDECTTPDIYRCKPGTTSVSQLCYRNVSTQSNRYVDTDCGSVLCGSNGRCLSECTGTQTCDAGGNYLWECSSSGSIVGSQPIDKCYEKGCDIANSKCKNECPSFGAYSCEANSTNSRLCDKKSNNQLVYKTIDCGIEGCNQATGKCKALGDPDSFLCIGSTIWSTDHSGSPLLGLIDCSNPELKKDPFTGLVSTKGLQPFCAKGLSNCKMCTGIGALTCAGGKLYQCGNIFTGESLAGTPVTDCEVSCSVSAYASICDKFSFAMVGAQNFGPLDDMNIVAKVQGTSSKTGIATSYIARITGGGEDTTLPQSNTINGELVASFGRKPLGSYNITFTFPEYPTATKKIIATVVNDFKITLSGDVAKQIIPGRDVVFTISLSNDPDSIPCIGGNLTCVATRDTIGKWIVKILNPQKGTGYDLKLTPVKGGVNLPEQTITVGLEKPKLSAATSLLTSDKPGTKNVDIHITGASEKTKPDSVKATISHSPPVEVELRDMGSGDYTFSYDFTETGTYTLAVTASKEGYDDVVFSKTMEITSSGEPTGDCTSGNTQACKIGTCAGTQLCSGSEWGTCTKTDPKCAVTECKTGEKRCSDGTCKTDCDEKKTDYMTFVYIGIGAVVVYLIWRGKKR